MNPTPLVSIVTPCLNMAQYVEQAINSVLAQDYPLIEYVVVDGGSTDGTLDILKRYERRLRFVSSPDNGVADAINRGFRLTSGPVFAYLNADDYYTPGAVTTAVRQLQANPEAGVVYGEAEWVDERGARIGDYPIKPFEATLLETECFICQPAAFLRRDAFERAGLMDLRWPHTFDYDLWIRLARRFPMVRINDRLAASRMHRSSISLGSRRLVHAETIRLLIHHFGYAPFGRVHSFCAFLLDRRDQFFEPLRPSFSKYALSLPVGLRYNWRHPLRFSKDWCSIMSLAALRRRLSERLRPG